MRYQKLIELGSGLISDSMKMLLYKQNLDLFEKIDFENDRAFTEPLLFAYFNSISELRPSLEQLLWNYFKEENKLKTFDLIIDDFWSVVIGVSSCN